MILWVTSASSLAGRSPKDPTSDMRPSADPRPTTLLKTVDIMVCPIVPPSGLATATRDTTVATWSGNMPMAWMVTIHTSVVARRKESTSC